MKNYAIKLKQGQTYSGYYTSAEALFKAVLSMYEHWYNSDWGYTEVTV